MKKCLKWGLILLISLIFTLFTFEALSWYHVGDAPTFAVALRLSIAYVIAVLIIRVFLMIIVKICDYCKQSKN